MLRDYNIFINLDTRDLNSKYPLDNYKFTKRNGVLTLYKPVKEPSYKEPILSNKEPVINPVIIKPVAEEPMSYAPGKAMPRDSVVQSPLAPDNALEPIILHMDNKIANIELSVSGFVKSMESCLQNLENRLDNYRDALNNVIGNVNANSNSINKIANVVDNHAKLINNI